MCLNKKEIDLLEAAVDVCESAGFNVSDDREVIAKLRAAQEKDALDGARVCPECDGAVEFCAMGHYVPAKTAPQVI